MTVIAFEGGLGSGKTLGMTFFLLSEQQYKNKKIYSNYKLDCPYEKLDMSQILAKMGELQDVAIGIDEIHIFMDSRMAVSKKNRLMSYFALQTRKRNVSLYFTSQFLDQVDKRLRRLVDYRFLCESAGKDWFHYTMYDLTQTTPRIRTFYLNGINLYERYSTDEIIDIE